MPNARGKNPLLLYSTKKMYPFKKKKKLAFLAIVVSHFGKTQLLKIY